MRYWSQLEARTKQTIDFLQLAAEARCGFETDTSSRAGRKRREKRKNALETLEELISRVGMERTAAIQSLYEPLAELLRERAEIRRLWKKRENDHVFRELDRSQRPLTVPFAFNDESKSSGDGNSAASPLPEDLSVLADCLVGFGRAFVTGDSQHLPIDVTSTQPSIPTNATKQNSTNDSHCQPYDWVGWNDHHFGLEMQSPWAGLLLEGKKTIETRAYDLPPALIGKRIEILQSKQGNTASALGNVVSMTDGDAAVTRVGWCRFTHSIRYDDRALFDADRDAHLVATESDFYPFNNESNRNVVYGWVVGEFGLTSNESSGAPLTTVVRRYRSLFELQFEKSNGSKVSRKFNKRKKRRRY